MRRFALLLCVTAVAALTVLPTGPALGLKLAGTPAAEAIFGTPAGDKLVGGGGNDFIFGGGGKDVIKTGSTTAASVHTLAGPGRDVVKGGPGLDIIIDEDGTPKDVLKGGNGFDQLSSVDGAKDILDCGKGPDLALADPQDKVKNCETIIRQSLNGSIIFGTSGPDALGPPAPGEPALIVALGGDDTVVGAAGRDNLLGGPGSDSLDGAGGSDLLYDDDGVADVALKGGTENDTILSADGASEPIDCGESAGDNDLVFFFTADTGVDANCETPISGLGQVVLLP